MEDNYTNSQSVQEIPQGVEPVGSTPTPEVGFPTPQPKPQGGKGNKLVFVFLGVLLIAGAIVFVISKTSQKEEATVINDSTVAGYDTEATSTPTSTSTPTPTSKVDRTIVKVTVQNGTGIPGEAAYLQTQLKTLGYTQVGTGNASAQDATITTATFSKGLPATVIDEITKKLQEIYKEVDTKVGTTSNEVVVVTGVRKGATTTPTKTPTPTATKTPTPTE